MTILYLASFIGGLLYAVRVMLNGVERPREENPSGERSFRVSPPVVATFAVVFGVAGYAMTRALPASLATNVVVAAGLGILFSVIAARLVLKWWTLTPEHDVEGDREMLQGHLARVTKSIRADVDGEVAFDFANEHRVLRARSCDAGALVAGTEVVIEHIDDDVAYVEAWAEVEKRL
jgi:membrane protein implicated in regulation of membrane protease activity